MMTYQLAGTSGNQQEALQSLNLPPNSKWYLVDLSETLERYNQRLVDPTMLDAQEIAQCEIEDLFQAIRVEPEAFTRIRYHCDTFGKDELDQRQLKALAGDLMTQLKDAGLYNERGKLRAEFYRFEGDTTLLLKQSDSYVEPTFYDDADIPF